jgi:hypothetical protein
LAKSISNLPKAVALPSKSFSFIRPMPATSQTPAWAVFGIGITLGDRPVDLGQHLQRVADPVVVHQRQGVQAGGVNAREPVGLGVGQIPHLLGGPDFSVVVADRQRVQIGDHHIAGVVLAPRGGLQPVVPEARLLELALVQIDPGHMIEPVQTLAVAPDRRRLAEAIEGAEVRRARAAFDRLDQGCGATRRRRGLR